MACNNYSSNLIKLPHKVAFQFCNISQFLQYADILQVKVLQIVKSHDLCEHCCLPLSQIKNTYDVVQFLAVTNVNEMP